MSSWWRFWTRTGAADRKPSLTHQTDRFLRRADWLAARNDRAIAEDQRALSAAFVARRAASVSVWCSLCADQVVMPLPWAVEKSEPNLRESLVCPQCHLSARARAALGLLHESQPSAQARVYVTEQASPAYVWLRRNYLAARGSEYAMSPERQSAVENWLGSHGAPGPIVFEDVTALSFSDASLDAVASFDVLEHVPDYPRALAEFARVLRPGGQLWLTVPFLDDCQDTLVRARIDARGDIEHLLPAEIHGDPVSDGVLCYYHFGWDLLDAVRAAGFSEAAWCRTWAPGEALFGLWTLRAVR